MAGSAFAFGNPFNGVVFALAALALAAFGTSSAPVARAGTFATWAGIAALAYGSFYPHFLATPIAYVICSAAGSARGRGASRSPRSRCSTA